MPNLLLIMLGGAIGAAFRYHVARVALEQLGPVFPWGTFIVNLVGGFLMGVLAGLVVRDGPGAEPLLLFLGEGRLHHATAEQEAQAEREEKEEEEVLEG